MNSLSSFKSGSGTSLILLYGCLNHDSLERLTCLFLSSSFWISLSTLTSYYICFYKVRDFALACDNYNLLNSLTFLFITLYLFFSSFIMKSGLRWKCLFESRDITNSIFLFVFDPLFLSIFIEILCLPFFWKFFSPILAQVGWNYSCFIY